jgi:hypothetical protein
VSGLRGEPPAAGAVLLVLAGLAALVAVVFALLSSGP